MSARDAAAAVIPGPQEIFERWTNIEVAKWMERDPQRTFVTWLFDVSTRKWRDLAPPTPLPSHRTHIGLSYDSKNKIVLLHGATRSKTAESGVVVDTWVYLPGENKWLQPEPKANPYAEDGNMLLAYDPEHNVHVLGNPPGWRRGSVWVYRYK